MDKESFLHFYKLINENLIHCKMSNTFNSIGSNVFFEFGKKIEILLQNEKKHVRREWTLWISNTSWRISKGEEYIVGSGDQPKVIQSNIKKLLENKFQSFHFLSQFLDIELNFEKGYRITSFFERLEEDQWTIFLPDKTNIGTNCENFEEIKIVQNIAKHFPIVSTYKEIKLPKQNLSIIEITYNEYDLPKLILENAVTISLESCTWRLEKSSNYVIGYLDDSQEEIINKMSKLVGKKLKQVDVSNVMMDARFQFEDGYVLKTFTCSPYIDQWKICVGDKVFFAAEIQIS